MCFHATKPSVHIAAMSSSSAFFPKFFLNEHRFPEKATKFLPPPNCRVVIYPAFPKPRGRPLLRSSGTLTCATLPWGKSSIRSRSVVASARWSMQAPVFMTVDFKIGFAAHSPGANSQSLPEIFRRVAYPVEPLGFKFVLNQQPPPLPDGIRDGLREQPDLFEQLDGCHANEFQYVHSVIPLVL